MVMSQNFMEDWGSQGLSIRVTLMDRVPKHLNQLWARFEASVETRQTTLFTMFIGEGIPWEA